MRTKILVAALLATAFSCSVMTSTASANVERQYDPELRAWVETYNFDKVDQDQILTPGGDSSGYALQQPDHGSSDESRAVGRLGSTWQVTNKIGFAQMVSGCTATVIDSPGRNLIVTAAHCVHDKATKALYTNFSFTPAYKDGEAPYGTWTGTKVWSIPAYAQHQRSVDDIAVIALEPDEQGRQVQDVVGGYQAFWPGSSVDATTIGYPSVRYDGKFQRVCEGRWTMNHKRDNGALSTVNCAVDNGHSGGPVFIRGTQDGNPVTLVVAVAAAMGMDDHGTFALAAPLNDPKFIKLFDTAMLGSSTN